MKKLLPLKKDHALKLGVVLLTLMALGCQPISDDEAIRTKTFQILSQFKNNQAAQVYSEADPEFIKENPENDFIKDISSCSILKNYSAATISKVNIDTVSQNNSTAEGTLIDIKGNSTTFGIELQKNDKAWKFLNFEFKDCLVEEEDTAKIIDIIVGKDLSKDGHIIATKTLFSDSEILATVLVENQSSPEIKATAKLINIETNEEFETFFRESIVLRKDNPNTTSSVSFLPTTKYDYDSSNDQFNLIENESGWEKGKYKVVATLKNGEKKEVEFEIK